MDIVNILDRILGKPLSRIAGRDFIVIADTESHTGLNCSMITPLSDTVFNTITSNGVNIVEAKGLSSQTIPLGMLIPFGINMATEIKLTSGAVIAYID